jgi:hypothetical protein
MLKAVAAMTIIVSVVLLLQGQQYRPTIRPTGPMPPSLIP